MHLHVHGEHGVARDAISHVADIVRLAHEDGQPAVALSDHGSLAGIFKLVKECKARGMKAVPAQEVYLAWGDRAKQGTEAEEKTLSAKESDKKWEHLTLLVRSAAGWDSMVRLSTESQRTQFSGKPLVDWDLLAKYGDGLIALTGCLGGPVASRVARGDLPGAIDACRRLIAVYGSENVYVEIMDHDDHDHPFPDERDIIPGLAEVARACWPSDGLGESDPAHWRNHIVATNDSHYSRTDQVEAHDAWLARKDELLDDPNRWHFHGGGYHMRTASEMRALFDGDDLTRTACDTTLLIAARIDDDILPESRLRLPRFPVPDGYESSQHYLFELIKRGLEYRYGVDGPQTPAARARAKYEFDIIRDAARGGLKDMCDYFLIVNELMIWARTDGRSKADREKGAPIRPIRVGYGRGSAAGSIVSYALRIVGIDPLRFDLLFERFLEPGRDGMPDIDLDFEQARLDDVRQHLVEMYGDDFVVRIGSNGVSRPRASVKRAARLVGDGPLGEKLSKLIPHSSQSFAEWAENPTSANAEYDQIVAADPAAAIVGRLAGEFDGTIQTDTIHACGMIISSESLVGVLPVRLATDEATGKRQWVSQWNDKDVEEFGLLKLDVLGIQNLDIVTETLRMVREDTGETFDTDVVPEDPEADPFVRRAWDLLAEGDTSGLFQMESSGITKLAMDAQPSSLEDISAIVALYRPGPMGMGAHDTWARRSRGQEQISYDAFTADPAERDIIASILGPTQAVTCYQEQIMSLCGVVAGFDDKGRSKVRKAVGKKIQSVMDEVGREFLAGAVQEIRDPATGEVTKIAFRETTAQALWKTFEAAGSYAFNKSHSVAYGYLSYLTAYLKARWPVHFAAALLAVTDKDDRRLAMLNSVRRSGIVVLPPHINRSARDTAVIQHEGRRAIQFGLSEIKGVKDECLPILAERDANGDFDSLDSLARRVRFMKANIIEALIESGACDHWGPRLGLMQIVRGAGKSASTVPQPIPPCEWGALERTGRERSLLGVALSGDPMDSVRPDIQAYLLQEKDALARRRITGGANGTMRALKDLAQLGDRADFAAVGILAAWKEVTKGFRRASITLIGSEGSIDGTIWDRTLEELRNGDGYPQVNSIVLVSGRIQVRELEPAQDPETAGDGAGSDPVEAPTKVEMTIYSITAIPIPQQRVIAQPELLRRTPLGMFASADDQPSADTAAALLDEPVPAAARPASEAPQALPETAVPEAGEPSAGPPLSAAAALAASLSGEHELRGLASQPPVEAAIDPLPDPMPARIAPEAAERVPGPSLSEISAAIPDAPKLLVLRPGDSLSDALLAAFPAPYARRLLARNLAVALQSPPPELHSEAPAVYLLTGPDPSLSLVVAVMADPQADVIAAAIESVPDPSGLPANWGRYPLTSGARSLASVA